jgi:hypothetical protein
MPNKRRDGIKSAETKVASYGPAELDRAGKQAAWTKLHRHEPKGDNPFLRSKIYTPLELERAQQFQAWKRQNPGRVNSENPHCWRP